MTRAPSPILQVASITTACLLAGLTVSLHGQVSSAAGYDPPYGMSAGTTSDAVRTTPPATLGEVADNAASVYFADHEHGPVNVGLEVRGAWYDNVFNSPRNQQATEGYNAGVPVGVRWRGKTSDLEVNYRLDVMRYPGYSSVDSISQTYQHQWRYKTSEATSYFWDGSAGRVASLGQYLPVAITIGGTGVVAQSNVGSSVLQNSYISTSVASAVGFVHDLDEHDTITGTATVAWIEQAQREKIEGQPRAILRSEPAGADVTFAHEASSSRTLGAELTNVYVRGLVPSGHLDITTVEATYGYRVSPALSLTFAAGPLFYVSNSAATNSNSVSYAADASLNYTTSVTHIRASYAHVLQLGYLEPATAAQQISIVFDRPLNRSLDLTVDGRYVRSSIDLPYLRQSDFGFTALLVRHLTNRFELLLRFALVQQAAPVAASTSNGSFSSNEASVGITYWLGNPLTRGGIDR